MYRGVLVPIITPFTNGKIDEPSIRKHVSWLLTEGVHGIVPCGTTGEGATLTHPEYAQVIKIVVNEVNGKCPVIAGAGANSTAKAIELAQIVVEAGAEATLQVTPYYNKPMQEGLYEHYKAIANAVKKPHLIYNVPGRTAVNILPATVARLSRLSNIVGIKEASGDLAQVEKLKTSVPEDFCILSGNDDQNFAIYERGGCGTISVTANIAPDEVANIWNSFDTGKIDEAKKLQASIEELNKTMFIETNPIPVKTSLHLMGMCKEEFRLPLTPISKEHREELIKVLKKYKIF